MPILSSQHREDNSWIAKRGEAKLFRKRASVRRWQKETNYGRRALVETAMGRYKAIIGACPGARGLSGQRAEAAGGVAVPNGMLGEGHPHSVRRLDIAA